MNIILILLQDIWEDDWCREVFVAFIKKDELVKIDKARTVDLCPPNEASVYLLYN